MKYFSIFLLFMINLSLYSYVVTSPLESIIFNNGKEIGFQTDSKTFSIYQTVHWNNVIVLSVNYNTVKERMINRVQ